MKIILVKHVVDLLLATLVSLPLLFAWPDQMSCVVLSASVNEHACWLIFYLTVSVLLWLNLLHVSQTFCNPPIRREMRQVVKFSLFR